MYATGDIVKTRQSAPYDHVPGWRIVVAVEVPAEHSDLEQVSGQAPVVQTRGRPGASIWSSTLISAEVKTELGVASGLFLAVIVRKKMRQLTTAMRARNFASRSEVSSLVSSARQPDFMTLWNVSIFQRRAYQPSFSTAAAKSATGRFVVTAVWTPPCA